MRESKGKSEEPRPWTERREKTGEMLRSNEASEEL